MNSHAFNILMQPFLKTLNHHALYLFIFLGFLPPRPFRGKGMVAFLCNMLILCGGTQYPEPGNYMKFPIFEV